MKSHKNHYKSDVGLFRPEAIAVFDSVHGTWSDAVTHAREDHRATVEWLFPRAQEPVLVLRFDSAAAAGMRNAR